MALIAIAMLFGRGNEVAFAENELLAAAVVAVSNQSAKYIINNWKANAPNFVVQPAAESFEAGYVEVNNLCTMPVSGESPWPGMQVCCLVVEWNDDTSTPGINLPSRRLEVT
jgi:hypothetical protein